MKDNMILKASYIVFSYSEKIQFSNFSHYDTRDFKKEIHEAFSYFEKVLIDQDVRIVLDAKYALAAYIDEIIACSQWPGRAEWLKEPLQVMLFHEHLAGENFFKRLDQLQEYPQKNINLLELYYVCMQLGFKGKYRISSPEQLLGRMADLRNQIELVRGIPTQQLSHSINIDKTLVKKIYQKKQFWLLMTVLIIPISYYFYCLFSINHYVDIANSQIYANTTAINQILHQDHHENLI